MSQEQIRIMTFNIWVDGQMGGQPLSQTAAVIRAGNADVVGMQEVIHNTAKIAEMLGWEYVQQGPRTAVLSRLKLLGTSPRKQGVRVRLDSGREFFLFNVHLPHAPYQPYQLLRIPYADAPFAESAEEAIAAARAARGRETAALLEEIEQVQPDDLPLFLTGDFNEPSHLDWTARAARAGLHPLEVAYPTSREILAAGFADAYRSLYADEVARPGKTWTPRTRADDPQDHHDRIDFVYLRGSGIQVRSAQIVGPDEVYSDILVMPYPSDHRAVVVTFLI